MADIHITFIRYSPYLRVYACSIRRLLLLPHEEWMKITFRFIAIPAFPLICELQQFFLFFFVFLPFYFYGYAYLLVFAFGKLLLPPSPSSSESMSPLLLLLPADKRMNKWRKYKNKIQYEFGSGGIQLVCFAVLARRRGDCRERTRGTKTMYIHGGDDGGIPGSFGAFIVYTIYMWTHSGGRVWNKLKKKWKLFLKTYPGIYIKHARILCVCSFLLLRSVLDRRCGCCCCCCESLWSGFYGFAVACHRTLCVCVWERENMRVLPANVRNKLKNGWGCVFVASFTPTTHIYSIAQRKETAIPLGGDVRNIRWLSIIHKIAACKFEYDLARE